MAKGAIIFQKFFIVRRNSVITELIGLGSCKGPFEVKKESTQMCLCEENVLQKIPQKPTREFQNSCHFSGL